MPCLGGAAFCDEQRQVRQTAIRAELFRMLSEGIYLTSIVAPKNANLESRCGQDAAGNFQARALVEDNVEILIRTGRVMRRGGRPVAAYVLEKRATYVAGGVDIRLKKEHDNRQEFFMRLLAASLAIGVLLSGSAFAQYMISAHSGVVQSVDGRAYLEDQPVQPKFGQFPDIKENQKFRTEDGRAEILLTPGVFLRMGENSSIQMVSNKLTDTRVEVLSGSAMVECDDVQKNEAKDNVVTLLYKGNTMLLVKHGLYRVDTDPGRFQVYDGEAIVKDESGQVTLRSGKETSLSGALMAENFDKKAVDDLYLWSSERSSYLAKASASSATTLRNSLSGGSYTPWQYNSMFGMFTYVPYGGMAYSPFGWGFYSPYSVFGSPYYSPYAYGGYGYGGGALGRTASFSPYTGSRWGTGSPASRGYSAPSVGSSGGGSAGGSSSAASVSSGGGGSFGGGAHMGGGGGAGHR
jgi:hypothetical protein